MDLKDQKMIKNAKHMCVFVFVDVQVTNITKRQKSSQNGQNWAREWKEYQKTEAGEEFTKVDLNYAQVVKNGPWK